MVKKRTVTKPDDARGFLRTLSKYLLAYAAVFTALVIAYIFLTFLPTPDKSILNHYNLSVGGYYWLVSSLVALIILISAAGLYGSLMAKAYSSSIKRSADGRALNNVSNGFLVLSITFPFSSVLSSAVSLIAKHHASWLPTLTIINNYIDLVLMAAAFVLIARGSDGLYKLIRPKVRPFHQKTWVALFIIVSSFYTYFILSEAKDYTKGNDPYFLHGWLLILTIAIPYLYFWYRGLSAVYNIFLYQKNISGFIYKSVLKYLAAGIGAVIISSVCTRIIVTISPELSGLKLTALLFIIYALVVVDAAGYVLIAIGAKKLRRIEEV